MPYQFGYKGIIHGDVPNDLLAISQEPNVRIMETKALVCSARPGRVPKDQRAVKMWEQSTREAA